MAAATLRTSGIHRPGYFKRYGGYYSGRPAELFPPDYAVLGQEVVDLAGGAEPIFNRVNELKKQGQMELACQLTEWVIEALPENAKAWKLYGLLFKERAEAEFNMQARGAWNQAVRRAVANLERLES